MAYIRIPWGLKFLEPQRRLQRPPRIRTAGAQAAAMLSILRKRRPQLEGDHFIGSLRVRMPLEDGAMAEMVGGRMFEVKWRSVSDM